MAEETLAKAPSFEQIVAAELKIIRQRREILDPQKSAKPKPAADPSAPAATKLPPGAPGSEPLEVVALALSGGGIRSASFCLGVLQALNEHKCLQRIDYLSTVSGGGYMGTAMSASMAKGDGKFFFSETTGDGSQRSDAKQADVKDSEAVRHIRNYSNYLIPSGLRDVLTALSIILRGLAANLAAVFCLVLICAGGTILGSPTRQDLYVPNIFHWRVAEILPWLGNIHFGITMVLSLLGLVLFLGWAVIRSVESHFNKAEGDQSEFRTKTPIFFTIYLVVVAVSFVFELQPFVLAGMFDLVDQANLAGHTNYSWLTALIEHVTKVAAPLAALVTFFRGQISTLFKSVTTTSRVTTKALALAVNAAIWVAGAALPLLIWVGYLNLCYWGIINDGPREEAKKARPEAAIHATIEVKGSGIDLTGKVECGPGAPTACVKQPSVTSGDGDHTPGWLIKAATWLSEQVLVLPPFTCLPEAWIANLEKRPITLLYFTFGLLLLIVSFFLTPNANSLHRLYRDRLSKAFVFNPVPAKGAQAREMPGHEFPALDTMKLTELVPKDPKRGPYHLINATLNVQGSDYANRRGRNSDFFLFSPLVVGSEATGYARTAEVQEKTAIDLPTAMAISGAAFSPNAGANSIPALTPTLALLNVRTGYWLRNPRFVAEPNKKAGHRLAAYFYLYSEVFGTLYEDTHRIYLSDGGHVENLGLYELLRRRCRIIIVADAEADPSLRYPSFITLQRYARIDLGVRINMPWDEVRKTTLRWMGYTGDPSAGDKPTEPPTPSHGPHVAIGTIDYDGGHHGYLVYIKSSLTGDENDYVRDYARRYDAFPHESTGDQFFSEEQFEVYRALGFHITNRWLNGDDEAQVYDNGSSRKLTLKQGHPNVDPIHTALKG